MVLSFLITSSEHRLAVRGERVGVVDFDPALLGRLRGDTLIDARAEPVDVVEGFSLE
jgi:hypothetical protein